MTGIGVNDVIEFGARPRKCGRVVAVRNGCLLVHYEGSGPAWTFSGTPPIPANWGVRQEGSRSDYWTALECGSVRRISREFRMSVEWAWAVLDANLSCVGLFVAENAARAWAMSVAGAQVRRARLVVAWGDVPESAIPCGAIDEAQSS